MNPSVHYICADCGKNYPLNTAWYCCECGGLFTLPPGIAFRPDAIDTTQWTLFRYRQFFPLDGNGWQAVSLGEGMTPVVPFDEQVLLKLDYEMPTLSFKDRGAALVMWLCRELGVKRVIQDSSGNAGNAIAAYCGRVGIPCSIYVPKGTSPKKMQMIESHGAEVVVVDGSRDETARVCRHKAGEGVFYASHVYNPFFYEGTKTYAYEVYEQLDRLPDNWFIPVGNGTLLLGVARALREWMSTGLIGKPPKIYAVQSEHCDPLFRAYQAGKRERVPCNPRPTLAEGIAIGEPMRHREVLEAIAELGGEIITCPEEGIPEAKSRLARQGFFVEDTTAATMAAYISVRGRVKGTCLLPLCGAGLKSSK